MNMLGEEPPYLSVGTEVSAKYKGAFCEAKVRKVDRVVKCKVAFKLGFGSHTVLDNQIKGLLRVGANIEARHPDKKEFVEGSITKIQDCSQYTVVFDDGDITTLRRSALCLKSGRHFAESETLDQLPLTHPEHFGNPVVGGRRGGRRRLGSDESSGEEEVPRKGKPREEREAEIGKVVCVELGDKKKSKDNWFPGLVVAPNAQDTVRIRVKEEFLVRSFKDARYYTVPKKEASEFTREIGLKVDNHTLKAAVEKALTFLDRDELPPHWDRDQLFSLVNSEDSDSDAGMDSDSSDDEPREEKDHFVAQLYKFMDDRGTPINVCPSVCSRDLDLYKLFKVVHKMNGYNRVSNHNQWKLVSSKLGFGNSPGIVTQVKHAYKRFLHSFEDFYRKLGCTMVNHPRAGRSRNRGGRSLIRDKDRATPVNLKVDPAVTPKREEAGISEESTPVVVEVKKVVVKEEEVKPKVKVEETKNREKEEVREGDGPSDSEPVRPMSTLRKKFPTLKASPRTKDETPVLKRRAESRPETRPPSTRPKRALRENSMDDGRTSGEESVKVSQGPDEQRSTTRAKSKEDLVKQLVKKEIGEVRRGKSSSKSSDSEGSKKSKSGGSEDTKKLSEWPKGKRPAGDDPAVKRNRKRRNTDSTAGPETPAARPCLPRNKSVFVGDVLKVYYGSSSDPNGIYEAKVLDIEDNESGERLFLVHYAGWNSRYDEWVKRNKIAENLTWTARRAKASPVKGGRLGVKRKAPVGKGEPARSTTPSSITSSSSRTKSPATTPVTTRRRMMRRERPTLPGLTTSRRTRRISGHTEVSVDSQSDSGSESDESESDSETKSEDPVTTDNSRKKDTSSTSVKKTMTRTRPLKKQQADSPSDPVEKKKPRLMKSSIKVEKEIEETEIGSKVDQVDIAPKIAESIENNEETSVKPEADTEDPPKGRDFDLNEIRSELKGIDKAVKVPDVCELQETEAETDDVQVQATEDGEGERTVLDVRLPESDDQPPDNPGEEPPALPVKVEEPGCLAEEEEPEVNPAASTDSVEAPVLVPEEKAPVVEDIKEDVYEFKEPEPFEFQEVRRPIRIFDEIIERSPEKSITVKNVTVASSPMRATFEKREPSPQDDMKSRFRKSITKKLKEGCEEKRNVEADIKTEEEMNLPKEPPKLEIEDAPPQLVSVPVVEAEPLKQDDPEETPPQEPPHKPSPEPPCLLPVTEALPYRPPEQSPVLTREDPPRLPRLSTEVSSSDSESDERLVIANDEESTSSEIKPEPLPPPPIASPPPPLFPEERRETKRSPLSEIRLKRIEDRIKNASSITVEPQLVKEIIPSKPSTSGQKVVVNEKPAEEKDVREPDCSDSEGGTSSGSSGEGMRSLVCDEVIPGSPAPKDPADELPFQPPAASVMENTPPTTPPTTPDSNASSPREDRADRLYQSIELSSLDNESSKSHRDSSEVDLENEGHRNRGIKFDKRHEKEQFESPSKKKRSRKRSECNSESSKRGAGRGIGSGNRSRRDAHASDSDDTSENSMGIHRLDPLLNNRSPRPSKYNFCKEMAPDLDGGQKIAFLQHQLQELRKAYVSVKSQLTSIDRRRKKLRRKEREEKLAAAAAASAAAAAAAAEAAKVQDVPSQ